MSALRRTAVSVIALVAGAASFLVGTAAPAHAAINSPSEGSVVRSQPVVTGTQGIENETVHRVIVTLTPADGGAAVSAVGCSGNCEGSTGRFAAAFDLARNGTYTAVATAYHDDEGALDQAASTQSSPVTFGVEVAPAAPRRLVAEPDGGRREVTLSWTPNSEVDLLGYQVLRGVDGTTPQPHGSPVGANTTTYVDDATEGGQFTYQVVAIRRGATANSIVASEASNTASATIDRPTTTTTTAGEPSGSGTTSTTPGGAGGGTTGTTTAGGTGGGTGGSGDAGGLRPQPATAAPRITPGARLDLSGFTPNTVPLNLGPAPEPDSGFQQTLPYQQRPEETPQDDAAVDDTAQDQTALPVGSLTTTRTETNRRALLAFIAGAMLLFMLSMHLRWLLRRTAPVTG